MQTLAQLKAGKLIGNKSIKISEGLTDFPMEILELADTLEILDLSGNKLNSLPSTFDRLHQIKILFLSDNCFEEIPKVIGKCQHLEMVGFKSNQIKTIDEEAFPKELRWLILTNNQIQKLPESMGDCYRLQKCGLAGNQLKALPKSMVNCQNLELLRISANQLTEFPAFLLELPKLTWLAFAGNPFCDSHLESIDLELISWENLTILKRLGEGASGEIFEAEWKFRGEMKSVAVKIFKGDVTTDGYPADEMMAYALAGKNPSLVNLLGKLVAHPSGKEGLIFELIPPRFKNLADPPSFKTCTRDVFNSERKFSIDEIIKISQSVALVTEQLHQKNILHGDLYAHNTLIDNQCQTLFGDFGAASFISFAKPELQSQLKSLDSRSWGILMDDLLQNIATEELNSIRTLRLKSLANLCFDANLSHRPSFRQINQTLEEI
jgi:hypothetical protein